LLNRPENPLDRSRGLSPEETPSESLPRELRPSLSIPKGPARSRTLNIGRYTIEHTPEEQLRSENTQLQPPTSLPKSRPSQPLPGSFATQEPIEEEDDNASDEESESEEEEDEESEPEPENL